MKRMIGTAIGTFALILATVAPAAAAPRPRLVSATADAPVTYNGCSGFDEAGIMHANARERAATTTLDWTYESRSCLVPSTSCPSTYAVCYEETGTVVLHTSSGDIFGTFSGTDDAGFSYEWKVTFDGGTGDWARARGGATVTGARSFGGTVQASSVWTFSRLLA